MKNNFYLSAKQKNDYKSSRLHAIYLFAFLQYVSQGA